MRSWLIALGAALAALAVLVALRPAAGLMATVADPRGPIGSSSPPAPSTSPAPTSTICPPPANGRCAGKARCAHRAPASIGCGRVDAERCPSSSTATPSCARRAIRSRAGPRCRSRPGRIGPRSSSRARARARACAWDGRGRTATDGAGTYDEILLPRDLGPPIARAWWWAIDTLALVIAVLVAAVLWRLPWDVPRPPPVASPVTRGEIGWSLAGYAALVALMSWPLVTDLAGLGVMDRPDGRLNAWILAWDAHALAHAPGRLFQAPIFHPLPDTLAFSENLLVPAVIGAPFQALGGPVLAYNVVLLVSLIVSGLGVQLLVRRESGDRLAAFVAGAFFAAGAHRWIRLAHLHAQVTLFLPFVLLALDRFWQRRTLGRAALVGVLLALQGLSSVYLGAIAALVVAVAVALAVLGGLRPRELGRLAVGLVLAGRPAGADRPPVPPHARVRGRGVHDRGRGQLRDHDRVLRRGGNAPVRAGDAEAPRSRRRAGHAVPRASPCSCAASSASLPRRAATALLAVTASVVAVVFSLGPETAAYRFLHEHLVFVRGVRALSRFSLVPVLALSVLAGFALARRWRLGLARPRALPRGVEQRADSLRARRPRRRTPRAGWPGARARSRSFPSAKETRRPCSTGRRTGVRSSTATPASCRGRTRARWSCSPRPPGRTRCACCARSTCDTWWRARPSPARRLRGRGGARLRGAVRARRRRAGARAAVPTVWTTTGVIADLGAPRPVESVVFEVSDAPWVDAPAVEVSSDGVSWTPVAARASLADATLSLLRDPRHGIGEVTFPRVTARFVRVPLAVPARPGLLRVR